MQFDSIFTRGEHSFPVRGTVDQLAVGANGTLKFDIDDVPMLPPGPATLVVDGDGTWQIFMHHMRTKGGSFGESEFIVKGFVP